MEITIKGEDFPCPEFIRKVNQTGVRQIDLAITIPLQNTLHAAGRLR